MTRGSPPRTRGEAVGVCILGIDDGITPAYAGRRVAHPKAAGDLEDHPRVRGEKGGLEALRPGFVGSPPRTRGEAVQSLLYSSWPRITPAYAGRSPVGVEAVRSGQDHPRVRGEKVLDGIRNVSTAGSPPRTRGEVYLLPEYGSRHGITPAYAGRSCGQCP